MPELEVKSANTPNILPIASCVPSVNEIQANPYPHSNGRTGIQKVDGRITLYFNYISACEDLQLIIDVDDNSMPSKQQVSYYLKR